MYEITIILIFFTYILFLCYESNQNKKYRNKISHIIHVNGTRGKSSTSRLIEASIRGGEYRVFCKTTGTSPRTIDTQGIEKPIIRKGRANIKEQLRIVKEAAKQDADILVIECMAINPELQYISQHKILKADISIVTNVRRDHVEEMGPSLNDIAISLGKVMPKDGVFITAEKRFIDYYRELGEIKNTKVILTEDLEDDYGIDFKDNVSIALEVCKILGISKDLAIERMKNYKKDPGALRIYQIGKEKDRDIKFVNGLAINDPDSIYITYVKLKDDGLFSDRNFIILVNNRGDRAYRMKQHIDIIIRLNPDKVWIIGKFRSVMKRKLIKSGFNPDSIQIKNTQELLTKQDRETTIYAIGNAAGDGEGLLQYVEKVGDAIV